MPTLVMLQALDSERVDQRGEGRAEVGEHTDQFALLDMSSDLILGEKGEAKAR